MIPEFNEKGNLPKGFVKPKLEDFERRFVRGFKESNTRSEIFNGYLKYCSKILSLEVASLQWIDGSFTTNKINPKDIDFVTHVDGIKLDSSTEQEQELFIKLANKQRSETECKCDAYFIFLYPPEYRDLYEDALKAIEYWSKWFARDREENPKGLIELNLSDDSFDITNFNGGDQN